MIYKQVENYFPRVRLSYFKHVTKQQYDSNGHTT